MCSHPCVLYELTKKIRSKVYKIGFFEGLRHFPIELKGLSLL